MSLFLSLNNKITNFFANKVFALAFTLVLFLFVVLIPYSCSNKQVSLDSDITTIDFLSGLNNPRVVDLSEIASNVEYIPLETVEGALIGRYPKVSIGSNRIYVISARKEVKIFDIRGNYLFTFNRRGRGPEEYLYNQGFKFDLESGNIIVNAFMPSSIGMNSKVNNYDSLGNFLFSEQRAMVDSFFIESPIRIDEDLYLGAVPQLSKNKLDFFIVAFQKDGSIIKKISAPLITQQQEEHIQKSIMVAPLPGQSAPVINLTPTLYSLPTFTRVFSKYVDTLYSLDSNLRYKPEFIFNYGNIRADGTIPKGAKKGEGKFVTLNESEYQEWENFILFNFRLNGYSFEPYERSIGVKSRVTTIKHTDSYALFNKESAEFSFMKQPIKGKLGFRDNLKGGPPFIPQFITEDGSYAVSLLSAGEVLEHAQSGKIKGEFAKIASKVDEMDNHVVVLVKLK